MLVAAADQEALKINALPIAETKSIPKVVTSISGSEQQPLMLTRQPSKIDGNRQANCRKPTKRQEQRRPQDRTRQAAFETKCRPP
jgi:hypothetical protein